MRRTTRFNVLWAIWMSGGGFGAATICYLVTGSWWWALGALIGSGVVLNAIGQVVTQPATAFAASRHRRSRPHA